MIYDARGVEVTPEDQAFGDRVVNLGCASGRNNTINLAKRCIADDIPGDFVEAGVNMGAHPALMAYAIRRYDPGSTRLVHLYDSFQGVPICGVEDNREWQAITGVNPDASKGIAAGRIVNPRQQVERNMRLWDAPAEMLVYHEGWLQELLPAERNTPEKIALLRIDVDLYDSTIPVMRYLFPRVQKGGYVISDDWGEGDGEVACRKAVHRCLDEMGLPRPNVMRIPDTGGTVWWRV